MGMTPADLAAENARLTARVAELERALKEIDDILCKGDDIAATAPLYEIIYPRPSRRRRSEIREPGERHEHH